MPSKSFSIYSSELDAIADIDDRLVLEVGKTHIACIKKKATKEFPHSSYLILLKMKLLILQIFLKQFLQIQNFSIRITLLHKYLSTTNQACWFLYLSLIPK